MEVGGDEYQTHLRRLNHLVLWEVEYQSFLLESMLMIEVWLASSDREREEATEGAR